jgi:HlyD family secretion protein
MRKVLKGILSRPWLKWLVALALLGGVSYGFQLYRLRRAAGELPPGVQVGKVERQTLEQKITATGVVAAQTGAQVKIGAQLSGRIKRLVADVGQVVKVNQPIAELDLPEVEAQMRQARDSLAQAESRYEQARLTAGLTKETTNSDVRLSQAALNAADARLNSARAAEEWQKEQTPSEVARAEAAERTARSSERQVKASVSLQINQAQASIDSEKANLENLRRQLARSQYLHQRGFVGTEVVDNLRTQVAQSNSRLDTTRANYDIVKEKTAADLQAASDAVEQAKANRRAAQAGQMQDRLREAESASAGHARTQAEAQLAIARSNLGQQKIRDQAVVESLGAMRVARHQLSVQLAQLDKTTIRSPITGTVLSIAAQQGETVAAAFAAPTLIVVADLTRLEVKAYVDENDIGRVHANLPASITVDSYPDRRFHGHVTKIASASTIKDNVVTYETTIAIDRKELNNPQAPLKPDMTTAVEILLNRRADVLAVPSEAVKREGEQEVVYVLPPGALRPAKRVVKTGLDTGSDVEIKHGLTTGERVVIAGLDKFGIQTGFTVRR